jgi:hypothetical protein
MSNLQTTTIRVPKEVAESIKIYCKKHGKNVGDWVETAWNFIERNDFDIYDQDSTPFLPVQEEPQGKEVAALCKLMADFITNSNQRQLPNNREEVDRLAELVKWHQSRTDEKEEELVNVRETLHLRTIALEKAKSELRRLKKGIFNRPDEQVLKELGVM